MSTNQTSESSVSLLMYGCVGYISQGLLYGISNGLIACSIAKYEALNSLNQYILLMTLAFADAFTMLAFVSAGSYRLAVAVSGQMDRLLTPIECLMRPHVTLFMSATTLSTTMLVVLSADRLFLVAFPETYLLSLPNPGYARRIVGSVMMLLIAQFAVGIGAAATKTQIATEHVFCFVPTLHESESALSIVYVFFFEKVQPCMTLLSVIIFIVIIPVHKYRNNRQDAIFQNQQEAVSQKRMTKTLAISSACTLFLYFIPMGAGFWAFREGYHWFARTMFLLAMTNAFANVWIYQMRHPEMKMALVGFLRRKALSPNLNVWKANNKVVPVPVHVGGMEVNRNEIVMELDSIE